MPELCGSTTFNASSIANAASAAVPPWRRISAPACEARGSAELTIPGMDVRGRAGAAMAPVRARTAARIGNRRWRIGRALLGPDRLGNVGIARLAVPLGQAVRDPPRDSRALVNHR